MLAGTDYNIYGVCTKLSSDDIMDLGFVSLLYDKKTGRLGFRSLQERCYYSSLFLVCKKIVLVPLIFVAAFEDFNTNIIKDKILTNHFLLIASSGL